MTMSAERIQLAHCQNPILFDTQLSEDWCWVLQNRYAVMVIQSTLFGSIKCDSEEDTQAMDHRLDNPEHPVPCRPKCLTEFSAVSEWYRKMLHHKRRPRSRQPEPCFGTQDVPIQK